MVKIRPIYRTIIRRRETGLYLVCALYPLLSSLVSLFQAGLANYVGDERLDFVSFWSVIVQTQWQFAIPTLLLAYVVSSVFNGEIASKLLFLYKDIEKGAIYRAKIIGLLRLLLLFFCITAFVSFVSYFVFMKGQTYISGEFISRLTVVSNLLTIFSRLLMYLLTILLVAFLSSCWNSAGSILTGLFFMLVSNVAPQLALGKYLFPTGYLVIGGTSLLSLFGMTVVALVYAIIFYKLGLKKFEKVEF